eukprot:tig00000849_g4739.t1
MFEKIVADLLDRYLGKYVKGFNREQLNIGVWKGDIRLEKLELRPESLDSLNLPITVRRGYLGKLTLKVPWSKLKSEPVEVLIQHVYVLAAPNSEWDEAEEGKRRVAAKRDKLQTAEIIRKAAKAALLGAGGRGGDVATGGGVPSGAGASASDAGFAARIATRIVDNLQVRIENVHVRFEDPLTDPERPLALGATLESISARSTDEKYSPAYVVSAARAHKLVRLDSLSVYCNTAPAPAAFHSLGALGREEMVKAFCDAVARKAGLSAPLD